MSDLSGCLLVVHCWRQPWLWMLWQESRQSFSKWKLFNFFERDLLHVCTDRREAWRGSWSPTSRLELGRCPNRSLCNRSCFETPEIEKMSYHKLCLQLAPTQLGATRSPPRCPWLPLSPVQGTLQDRSCLFPPSRQIELRWTCLKGHAWSGRCKESFWRIAWEAAMKRGRESRASPNAQKKGQR